MKKIRCRARKKTETLLVVRWMMAHKLGFSDLDTSFVPNAVFNNLYWQICIDLALRSKSEDQRYGSIIVANGEIIGEGWNRLLGKREIFPFRTSFFLHAEKAAIGNAILNVGEPAIAHATVYAAGFFVKERKPLILRRITNTCVVCTKLYPRFGLRAAFIARDGWAEYSGELAYHNALENQKIRRERGLTTKQLRQEISL